MKDSTGVGSNVKIEDLSVKKWFLEEFSLVTGLYQLTYDGQWNCVFASDECFEVLKCKSAEFLNELRNLLVYTSYNGDEVTVESILQETLIEGGTKAFICVRPADKGKHQYIKGTLIANNSQGGALSVYGQITDVSSEEERDVQLRDIAMVHRAGVKMTGRAFYNYVVEGRRGIIPPETAKIRHIPENIDNLPEWNLKNGFVAEQSRDAWLGIFDAIDRGDKQGSADIMFCVNGGESLRRGRVEFVSIADENGKNISAIISQRDITNEYETQNQEALDRTGLLKVAQIVFPEILTVNLTKGTYRMIQYYGATNIGTPQEGPLDQMLLPRLENVAPEDQEAFRNQFFLEGQLKAINEGKERMQLTYRRRGADGVWHWMETIVVRQENPYNDDILTFAVSRNMDQQKAQEELLRQSLADSVEKLEGWNYYNSISSQAFPGMIYLNYEDGRTSPFMVGTLAERLDCPPKELVMSTCFRIPQEDRGKLLLAYDEAKHSGRETFQAEYRIETDRGDMTWVNNQAVHFTDKNGDSGYIHFLTDTTREHTLMERLRKHMEEQIERNEQIFDIVTQHSNRTLYEFDIAEGTTHPWNIEDEKQDILAHIYSGNYEAGEVEKNQAVMPESIEDVKSFFSDIHEGVPSGDLNIHIRMNDGQLKWYHFKYSSIFEGGKPVKALISVEDITERHEHEMAYRRHVQSVEIVSEGNLLYIESDLTADRIEKLAGLFAIGEKTEAQSYANFVENSMEQSFRFESRAEAMRCFSRKGLLKKYEMGEHVLQCIWKARFSDDSTHWIDTQITLMEDSYNGHVKATVRMMDITEEQEERMSIIQLAEFDAMTGLLRKEVGEMRIKELMEKEENVGGALIVLDLDDLKGINDTLGHKQGDIAIAAIGRTLKEHFRSEDILVRAGGDEFIAYLTGGAKIVDAIEASLEALLEEISAISIGENGETNIHCSIGCAIETPGRDSYDTLFKRADKALYFVKRNGKNNFVFYVPQMEQEDYEFRSKALLSKHSEKKFEVPELQHFIETIIKYYEFVLSMNLSDNTYYIMEEVKDGVFSQVPSFGAFDGFLKLASMPVHPDEHEEYFKLFSRESLIQAYERGESNVRYFFRSNALGEYRWFECLVIFYENERGDVCGFTLLRWADERDGL